MTLTTVDRFHVGAGMAKQDYPALLQPGVHAMTLGALQTLAVAPFPADTQRLALHKQFMSWVGGLTACGLGGTLWLDGSFLTQKVGPSDIDCVLWNPHFIAPSSGTPAMQVQVSKLLNRPTAKALFGVDLYVEMPVPSGLIHREAYWRGFFGFCHDRITAKGLAEVVI